ncbi:unnamed protein product [Bemisia tabaci]|uniref:Uncharacterized protein n=2 Tax=Bemisia tabaci TaxID=7038 RepID=A0A9P0EWT1_BEMTA|nr:unnamed protein product [Bemisia tabaci]
MSMSLVRELERRLVFKSEEIRRRDELICRLEKHLDERDALIRHLKNEIDKFRQIVRPVTQQIVQSHHQHPHHYHHHPHHYHCDSYDDPYYIELDRYPTIPGVRVKKQAISAEPNTASIDLPIEKVPKSSK